MILGQLLIFALLIGVELRVFFVKQAKKDSLVFISPLALVLSILLIISWGLNYVSLYVLIISVIVLFLNIYSLFKYAAKLLTDSYSSMAKSAAIFITILCLAGMIFTLCFVPVKIKKEKKLAVTETKEYYEGSFRTEFTPIKAGSPTNAVVYKYSPESESEKIHNVILLISDKRADSQSYTPYMKFLAKEGYTVCSVDFYTSDMTWIDSSRDHKPLRKFFMVEKALSEPSYFEETNVKNTYKYNLKKECDYAIKLLDTKFGSNCKYFLIGDVMSQEAVEEYAAYYTDKVSGFFCLNSLDEYNTPGFGIVEMTDPFLAKRLGQKKDRQGFYVKYLVLKTTEEISKAWSKKE